MGCLVYGFILFIVMIFGVPNEAGKRSTPEPKVVFLAWYTKNKVSLGNHETVKFDKVLYNIGGGYNPSTGHFTAPVSGIYSISASIMSEPWNRMYLGVMKNHKMMSLLFSNTHTFPQSSQTVNLPLKKGDVMRIVQLGGKVLHAWSGAPYNIFSGVLIDTM